MQSGFKRNHLVSRERGTHARVVYTTQDQMWARHSILMRPRCPLALRAVVFENSPPVQRRTMRRTA